MRDVLSGTRQRPMAGQKATLLFVQRASLFYLLLILVISGQTNAWMPYNSYDMTGAANPGTGMSTFGESPVAGEMGNIVLGYGGGPAGSYLPAGFGLNSINPHRGLVGSIGSICYCDIRINKLGTPGELLYKLHYPTINAQTCQVAIQQCATACRTQAQRQLTGHVLFEEGGLENIAPDKEVSVGTVLCKEFGKVISPPGVVASVFAKPDACGRAQPIYDLTGEESRFCCTLIAHPYLRTENVLLFSPECIAGIAPPAPAGAAAATAANGVTAAPPIAAEAMPAVYNQLMPQYRQYDPMNAAMNAMMNGFG